MLLAIDVGNTNTVFALHDGDRFLGEWRCATAAERTADEYQVWLATLIRPVIDPAEIDAMIVSSVVPQAVFNLKALGQKYFDCSPIIVGRDGCALPVDVRVDAGTQVGADRLVNTVGAYERYGGDLIVVDFGTATTFDVVAQDGAYVGGVIAPGVNLSLKALHEAAAALPHVDVAKPSAAVGRNTIACMQSGVFWGYVGLIERISQAICEERGTKLTVIGTGGLSALFKQGTDVFEHIDADITLHGLVLIHAHNQKDAG